MKDVIISDKSRFREKKKRVSTDGIKNLFVVSDFDRTLTKGRFKNKKISSLVAILREGDYLGKEYAEKAKALFAKYHPFEIDMNISFEEKNKKMHEWWTSHNKLFVKYGLSKQIIQDVIKKSKISFREGAKIFLRGLHQEKIPLVIISASSLGMIIDDYLEKNKVYFANTKIVTNYFKYNKLGKVIGAKDPIITTTNKYLAVNEHISSFDYLNGKKKNIILLGDNYEDENMANSFFHEDIIKVGFLNEAVDERLDDYKRVFDVVILNDGNMDYPNSLLRDLV